LWINCQFECVGPPPLNQYSKDFPNPGTGATPGRGSPLHSLDGLMKPTLVIAALIVLCPPQVCGANEGSCEIPTKGRYENANYGFSYRIPEGLSGHNGATCDIDENRQCVCWGDHSLVVTLDDTAAIGSYADYPTEIDKPTAKAVLRGFLDGLHAYGNSGDAKLRSVKPVTLDGRNGHAIQFTYTQDGVPKGEICYLFYENDARITVSLITRRGQLPKYADALAGVLASWKWTSNKRLERDGGG
jgi:hypothetical protein